MKKVISAVLCMLMVFMVTPTGTIMASAEEEIQEIVISEDTTWGAKIISQPTIWVVNKGVTLTLTDKITINSDLTISGGGKISMIGASSFYQESRTVPITLNIKDIMIDGNKRKADMCSVSIGAVNVYDGATI